MPLPYLKRSFNSTMVRLKVTSFLIIQPHIPKFQFHNGSIKRTIRRSIERLKDAFQFHNGSIKSPLGESVPFSFIHVSIPQWFD